MSAADDYRAFIFAVLNDFGMILLHCTRKKKGPHYQLPGGHIDANELQIAALKLANHNPPSHNHILMLAAKMAAARELWEETGLDIRNHLERLIEAPLKTTSPDSNEFSCLLEQRFYFYLHLTTSDFTLMMNASDIHSTGLCPPTNISVYPLPLLKLSVEHSSFIFEPDPKEAVTKLIHHSNGVGSRALTMAMLHK